MHAPSPSSKLRTLFLIAALSLSGCAARQEFVGPPEFQTWMQHALAQPDKNPAYHRFALAYRGDPEGLHAYFAEALKQAESQETDVEAGEALSFELQTIIRHIGDARFAAALAREPERVRSAVALCFGGIAPRDYPKTRRLLDETPKIDFPMLKTSLGG